MQIKNNRKKHKNYERKTGNERTYLPTYISVTISYLCARSSHEKIKIKS